MAVLRKESELVQDREALKLGQARLLRVQRLDEATPSYGAIQHMFVGEDGGRHSSEFLYTL